MTTDQHGEVAICNVQNQLTLVTLILINRGLVGIKMNKNVTNDRNCNISHGVEIIVGQGFTSLKASSNLGVIACVFSIRRSGSNFFHQFIRHGALQS